jgi:hypothetical protein
MALDVHGATAGLGAAGDRGDVDGALKLLSVCAATKLCIAATEGLRTSQHAAGSRARALVTLLAQRGPLCRATSVARCSWLAAAAVHLVVLALKRESAAASVWPAREEMALVPRPCRN